LLRLLVTNKKTLKSKHLDWALDVPSDVRNAPLKEIIASYKGNFTKGIHFVMKYRSKKWRRDTCVIEHKYWRDPGKKYAQVCYDAMKDRSAEPLPEKLEHAVKVLRDNGKYYYCISQNLVPKSDNQAPDIKCETKVASIDPGVRTFATVYDYSRKACYQWGKYDDKILEKYVHLCR